MYHLQLHDYRSVAKARTSRILSHIDMRQPVGNKGPSTTFTERPIRHADLQNEDIVLNKSIFSNIFNKDIRRAFIYKKAERLANALYLITPALRDSVSLRARAEAIAVALTEVAALAPATFREALSRELLALSSVLSMARVAGLLSPMNVELVSREVQSLLAEVSSYEEPGLAMADAPTLATLTRRAPAEVSVRVAATTPRLPALASPASPPKGPIVKDRTESILSLIRQKGTVTIKDISGVIRGVSEKTIQRELQTLIESGQVHKAGERRWSRYTLG